MNYFFFACRQSKGAGGHWCVGVGMCAWGGGVNAMSQLDFTGRKGGAQSASKITSVSHSGYLILCIQILFSFFTGPILCVTIRLMLAGTCYVHMCQWACHSKIPYQVGGRGFAYCDAAGRILCQWWNHGGRWYPVQAWLNWHPMECLRYVFVLLIPGRQLIQRCLAFSLTCQVDIIALQLQWVRGRMHQASRAGKGSRQCFVFVSKPICLSPTFSFLWSTNINPELQDVCFVWILMQKILRNTHISVTKFNIAVPNTSPYFSEILYWNISITVIYLS